MQVEEAMQKWLGEDEYSGWELYEIKKEAGTGRRDSASFIMAELEFLKTHLDDTSSIGPPLFVNMGDHHLQFRVSENPFSDSTWSKKVDAVGDKPELEEVIEFGNKYEVCVEFQFVDLPPAISVVIDPDEQMSRNELFDKALEEAKKEIVLGGLDGYKYQGADLGLYLTINEEELQITVEELETYSKGVLNHFLGYEFDTGNPSIAPVNYNQPENWDLEFFDNGDAIIENARGDRISVTESDGCWHLSYTVGGREPETSVPGESEFSEFYEAMDYVRDTVIAGGGWNG